MFRQQTAPRWAALRKELGQRTIVMGVINVTSDSFSGDGLGEDSRAALEQGRRFLREGAEILDVGGESTRPGHQPVAAELELQRVLPVIERLVGELGALVSIDTRKSQVADAAIRMGAEIVNDVTGLRSDPAIARVAADAGVGIVLQHWHPRSYEDTLRWITSDLEWSVRLALETGVAPENIVTDPGLGFGKEHHESLELIRRLAEMKAVLPYPILVGPSRKRFVGAALGDMPMDQRVEGTIGAAIVALVHGADIIRVHDVSAVARAVRVADAILLPGRATVPT
ncbi:MAG: dihydropteroate synthase [Chloroflexota bacterium]